MNNDIYSTLIGGDYAIDYLVLSKLPIDDILGLSNYGEYFAPICADNYFWYFVATYHIPGVIPTSGTSWFELVKFLTIDRLKNVNKGLALSAQAGNLSLVEYFIGKGACNWNWGMVGAVEGRHKFLIEYFISKGAEDWNFGMARAAEAGHKDLVEYFISKGADDFDVGISRASIAGHDDIVEYFINLGTNW